MESSPVSVYLSPHLDDAVLSCGGGIAERVARGETVWVVTLFTADSPAGTDSPLVSRLHRSWGGAEGVMERRRAEDVAACESLGARWRHESFVDAVYRRSSEGPLYSSFAEIKAGPRAEDADLQEELARSMESLPDHDEIFVPLAVGSHVDHLLVRRAAEARFGADRLTYYEDYPYSERRSRVEASLDPDVDWRCLPVAVSPASFRAKRDAVLAYRSQMRSLFKGSWLARLRLWISWRRDRCEYVWRQQPAAERDA